MKHDIVTIGDAFEDIFIESRDLEVKKEQEFLSGRGVCFELGEKIPLKSVEYEIGGSACNAAVGFSRLGLDASFVTVLGDDSPADSIRKRLEKEDIDQNNIKTIKSIRTNFSVVFRVQESRTIFVYHSLDDYSEIRLKKGLSSRWYFLAPIGEEARNLENDLIAKASEDKSMISWNPGGVQIKAGASRMRHLLKATAILFLNREESIKFLDYPVRPTEEEVLRKLFLLGPKIIVITNGSRGAKAFDGRNFYHIDAFNDIKKVDATGAGDSFATAFTSRMALSDWQGEVNSELVGEALRWGVLNSASVLGYVGAQAGLLRKTEMKEEAAKRRFDLKIT